MTIHCRLSGFVVLAAICLSGCAEPESPGLQSSGSPSSGNPETAESVSVPEQSGPFKRRFVITPFILNDRTLNLATPFAIQQIESSLDVSLEELEQKAPQDSAEKIAVDAMKLIRANDADGLVALASEDSHAGNVKFYAALGKQFAEEPKPLARYDLAHHTCVTFQLTGGPIPGVAIPLKKVDDSYQLFVTDQSASIQQFHFHLVHDMVTHPDATAPIPESSTQTSFIYNHPAASEPLKFFVTRMAGVGDDGSLVLPKGVTGEFDGAKSILTRHQEFWARFDDGGFEAIKDDIHPSRIRWFRKPDERRHHPYDNLPAVNQNPTYTLQPQWIAWTENVWAVGIKMTRFVTPDAAPTTRTVIELFVTDPDIGEPRYWSQAANHVSEALSDDEVELQISNYLSQN